MSDDAKARAVRGWITPHDWHRMNENGRRFVARVYASRQVPEEIPVAVVRLLPDGSFPPEVVERVARAMCTVRGERFDDWSEDGQNAHRFYATAALAALTETDQ